MSRRSQRRHDQTPSPAPRPKRGAVSPVQQKTDAMTDDMVAELWAEFAADHYEIVDQLPLELHRNSRLLRELDQESLVQLESLERRVREYIGYRVALVARKAGKVGREGVGGVGKGDMGDKVSVEVVRGAESMAGDAPPAAVKPVLDTPNQPPEADTQSADLSVIDAQVSDAAEDAVGEEDAAGEEDALGEEDAEGEEDGEEDAVGEEDAAGEDAAGEDAAGEDPETHAGQITVTVTQTQPSAPDPAPIQTQPPPPAKPSLASIASLVNELVRNREEKVAIAVGAYNTIDRHIRALDAALSSQETSLFGPPAQAEAPPPPPAQSRKRKHRKSEPAAPIAASPAPAPVTGVPLGIEVDPNEPRYCYCNQVSYGEMVGCDNDDCPHEWFHLSCLELTAPPAGDWMCKTCRPAVEVVQPKKKPRRR